MPKQRVLSGMRPTGKLHLGNMVGALDNWKWLQEEYECFFFAADWHALTTEYAHTEIIQENIRDMVIDWLSVGLSPEKSVLFIQSKIKEHAELHLLLSMITPLPWLERVPSYKEQQQELANRDLSTYGFLGYPLLQTADIIIYKAHKVPVGIDQVPHVELSREIARRFNFFYGDVFPASRTDAYRDSQIAGNRRPENEQKLRQCHLHIGPSRGDPEKSESHVHRSQPHPPERPRESGYL